MVGGWFLDHKSPLKAYNKIIQISKSMKMNIIMVMEEISEY